jgi:hypothetical protein
MVIGTEISASTLSPAVILSSASTAAAPIPAGSCCTTAWTKPWSMPLIAWAVRSQPNTLTLSLLALALNGGDGTEQRRLTRRIDGREVRIGRDQVLSRRKCRVLYVLAIDDAGNLNAIDTFEAAFESLPGARSG